MKDLNLWVIVHFLPHQFHFKSFIKVIETRKISNRDNRLVIDQKGRNEI